jgi:hypothetical protein
MSVRGGGKRGTSAVTIKVMAELVKGEATRRGFWAEVKVWGGMEIDRRRAQAKGGAIYPGD